MRLLAPQTSRLRVAEAVSAIGLPPLCHRHLGKRAEKGPMVQEILKGKMAAG